MMWIIKVLIVFALAASCNGLFEIPQGSEKIELQVTTANGIVQGRYELTDKGTVYRSFRGIPYAQPPINENRFRPPQTLPSWDGILDATEEGDFCLQITNEHYIGSEDCLNINVYSPTLPNNGTLKKNDLYPVMVWIHGGAFITGHSRTNLYGPDYLLDKNVLVITFNYRLGIFGFLSTQDENSPGNYGIKDQIAALKWIQVNVASFGGDPHDVTIFGESAGAASVSYLLLAPKAKGLFQKAISESGSALCPWAMQRNPRAIAFQVATVLGIITFNNSNLIERLRAVDSETLHTVSSSAAILNFISPLNGLAYSPTIEPPHEDAVLTEGPHELFLKGHFNQVPYIIGFNSEESSVLQEMVDYVRPYLISYDILPTNLVPEDMNIPKISLDYIHCGYKIKLHYFGLLSGAIASRKNILKIVSDLQFVKPIIETVRLMTHYVPIYFYEFSYEGNTGLRGANMDKRFKSNRRIVEGVGHSEEMWYLWKRENLAVEDYFDVHKSNIFTTLWTNFAKFRNPTPYEDEILENLIWNKSNESNKYEYLDIGDHLTPYNNPKRDVMDFWDDLYLEFGRPPYDTY